MPKLRLNKILAQAGLTSRRGAERLIEAGRVSLNGEVVRDLGRLADPAADRILVDERPLPAAPPVRWVLLHKPRGYVTTRHDPQGRPVVTDLVPEGAQLYPVGRLDADVEGVLLLTNDGPLTHRLLHPRYGVPRVYEAVVDGRVTPADLPRWRAGVTLDDGFAQPLAADVLETAAASRLRLTFGEGRKHEVKRYCRALGHPVRQLRRVAFGPVGLGDLPPGAARALTRRELASLRTAVDRPAERVRPDSAGRTRGGRREDPSAGRPS